MNDQEQHTFHATARSVRMARDFATRTLDSWGGCTRRDDIRACVSELAGNAVTHGSRPGQDYLVRLVRRDGCVHLEVSDDAPGANRLRPELPVDSATEGRGLFIVEALADDWGVEPMPGSGKTVWSCFAVAGLSADPPTGPPSGCPSAGAERGRGTGLTLR